MSKVKVFTEGTFEKVVKEQEEEEVRERDGLGGAASLVCPNLSPAS